MRELNNKLIAEFMGGIPSSVPNLINLPQTIGQSSILCVKGSEGLPSGTYKVKRINDLKYHSSWNWLMLVVEKIENFGFEFIIAESRCKIKHNTDHSNKEVISVDIIGIKKEAIYQAVVEFIKWYNKKARWMTELNNKLIAEFMELEMEAYNKWVVEYYHEEFDSGEWYEAQDLPYDEWNWIMPVVSKILTNENYIDLSQRENIMDSLPYGMIEDTYNAVVEFIKWYNNQSK